MTFHWHSIRDLESLSVSLIFTRIWLANFAYAMWMNNNISVLFCLTIYQEASSVDAFGLARLSSETNWKDPLKQRILNYKYTLEKKKNIDFFWNIPSTLTKKH